MISVKKRIMGSPVSVRVHPRTPTTISRVGGNVVDLVETTQVE